MTRHFYSLAFGWLLTATLFLPLYGHAAPETFGTIQGRVWNDMNNNGLQDNGEMGLGSVWVQVETAAGAWVNGGYTEMSGDYSFGNVPGGASYKVKIANPGNGFNAATPNVGNDDTKDSDVDVYGYSAVFALAVGQTVDIDGGLTTGGQCYTPVTATTSNVQCVGGNSFTFQITATGGTSFGGQSWGWDYPAGGLSMQPYGQAVTVGPFPATGPKTLTISDVDNPFCTATVTVNPPPGCNGGGGTPSLSINDVTVNEDAGTASLQICASSVAGSPITVQYNTSNGTAGAGSDYTTSSGTATIPAGQTCTTVTVPIVDDNVNEPTEVFNVNLTNPSGATIADGTGTVTILDNDAPGGTPNCNNISITGAAGSINITGASAPIVMVQAFNSSWAAVFNQTYTAPNPPGGAVTIPSLAAGQYFVKVSFLNANWTTICQKEIYVTVGGGGGTPTLNINDVTVNENAGTASLQICASSAAGAPITVQYSTSNGTAGAGSDYTTSSGTATIPAGQTCTTVTIPIVDDNVNEPTEVFNVNLTNPSGATIADPTGTVTILDNDQAPVCNISINISNLQCDGKGTASTSDDTYTFNLSVTGTGTGATWSGSFSNAYLGVFQFGPTAYGTSIPMGPFPAGAFTPSNVSPPITLQNGVNIDISVADSQNPACSKTLTVNSPGACSPVGNNCDNISIVGNAGSVTISGLSAPIIMVQAFNGAWAQVFSQTYTSPNPPGGTVTIPNLPAGQYFVKVDYLNAQWSPICKKEVYVTVTPPNGGVLTLTCTSDQTVTAQPGQNTAIVNYNAPSASTTCSGGAVNLVRTSGPASGAAFPVGTTQVCYQATDNCGNTKTCCFNVTVNPAPPTNLTLTCPIDMTVTASAGQNTAIVTYNTPTATTTCPGGAVNIVRTSGLASGSAFPVGTTQVCHQATDNCGNVKTCCFSVTVNPAPPSCQNVTNGGTIAGDQTICPGATPAKLTSVSLPSGGSGTLEYIWLSSTTGCPTNINQQIPGSTSSEYQPGPLTQTTWFVRCSRRAGCTDWTVGESNCVKITVSSIGCGTLTLTCTNNITVTAGAGQNSATVNYSAPTATTTCPGGSVNVTRTSGLASGSAFPVGTTQVCFQATDNCGNVKTCCFSVTVNPGGPVCNTTRTVDNSIEKNSGTGCANGATYGIWLNTKWPGSTNISSQYFQISGGSFVENSDGTATLTGLATNNVFPNVKFNVSVNFCGRSFNAPAGSPKTADCYAINSNGWYYYTTTCGTLTGTGDAAGAVIKIDRSGPAFQVGNGANINESAQFGASGWFNTVVQSHPTGKTLTYTSGDFNIRLSGSPTASSCGNGTAACQPCNTGFPDPTKCYRIVNKASGKALDADYNPNLVQWTIDYSSSQRWQFQSAGSNFWHIMSKASTLAGQNKVLDVDNSSLYEDAGVNLYTKHGGTNQQFSLQDAGGGYYYIVARHSGKAIKTTANPGTNGTEIIQRTISSANEHQKWQIVAIDCATGLAAQQEDLTFDAYRKGFEVQLKWLSNTGEHNDFFVVEHSTDGNNWQPIQLVEGEGASGELLQFDVMDKKPAKGNNFYRLHLVFRDGSERYSVVRKVNLPDPKSFAVFPNPAGNFVWLDLAEFEGQAVKVTLLDALGKTAQTVDLQSATREPIRLELGDLQNGHYAVQIESQGLKRTARLVVSKTE